MCVLILFSVYYNEPTNINQFQILESFGNCITPNSERGTCINLKECTTLYNLLQRTPLYDEDKTFLQRSQCGWNQGEVLVRKKFDIIYL